MKRIFSLLALLTISAPILAQSYDNAICPLDLPISLSGTYGELRHNHFHAGVDFRTGGQIGFAVHAIKDGYISKVSVSPTGYGNGVYITHYDGTMSVYGHLSSFTPEIAQRVLREQYSNESFSVSINFSKDEFPVKQGDVIGKSGNTGSSAGPHLHMEIREEDGNLPTNYLAWGVYSVEDNLSPEFQRVAFYGYEDSLGVAHSRRLVMLRKPSSEVIKVPRKSYVAIDAIDRMNGTNARLAVEKYRVLLDGDEIFCLEIGNVPYSIDSYIRSLIQSGEGGADMIKTQLDPANPFCDRVRCKDGGLFVIDDYTNHTVKIEVSDCFGKTSSHTYKICRDDSIFPEYADLMAEYNARAAWFLPNVFVNEEVSYSIAPGNLYHSKPINCQKIADADYQNGILSSVWSFDSGNQAMHKGGVLRIAVDTSAVKDTSKLVIASVGRNGRLSSVGGRYHNGYVIGSVGLGTYCVSEDCKAPEVTVEGGLRVAPNGNMYFNVRDDFSGVSTCSVHIDGKWVLSMLKGSRLTVYTKDAGIGKGKHLLSVTVIDRCGNETKKDFNIQL